MIDRRWLLVAIGVVTLIVGWVVWDVRASNPVGPWYDRAGNPVPDVRLQVWTGSNHCETANTKFMALSWPLGAPATEASRLETYVWEPPDDYLQPDVVPPEIVNAMPPDAKNTGFHRGQLTLWISESNLREAVFVTDGNEIQRWALVPGAGNCF